MRNGILNFIKIFMNKQHIPQICYPNIDSIPQVQNLFDQQNNLPKKNKNSQNMINLLLSKYPNSDKNVNLPETKEKKQNKSFILIFLLKILNKIVSFWWICNFVGDYAEFQGETFLESCVFQNFQYKSSILQLIYCLMQPICTSLNNQNQSLDSYRPYHKLPEFHTDGPKNSVMQKQPVCKIEELLTNQEDQNLSYFFSFFSARVTVQSLKRRNDNLEAIDFEDPDLQPDEVYNRRKKKVEKLILKDEFQFQEIFAIKQNTPNKFNAIAKFIQIFCYVKFGILQIKTDYYSSKTFHALKNATEEELDLATKVVCKIYKLIQQKSAEQFQFDIQERNLRMRQRFSEFLIIPRFLISKQKINKLSRDQQLQENFTFLIMNECLGHYNNEANKKMPEPQKMEYIRQLISTKDGHQKFRKICSINHGNKFFRKHQSAYYDLYNRSLEYLKYLDTELKKGKKYENIKNKLQNFKNPTEETIRQQNQSSSNSRGLFSFNSFTQCLKKLQKQEQGDIIDEQIDKSKNAYSEKSPSMKKQNSLKYLTASDKDEDQLLLSTMRRFTAKKSATMQSKKTKNFILIAPQHNQS